jgi:4-amino-4-deoxy-L-arabinose transferase-like glycosyltransferase
MRLPSLLYDGLWRDQANVYVQITAPSFHEFFRRLTGTEWHPPLYFLLSYGWAKIAGVGEFSLTILPFIFSILTVPAVYLLGSIVHSRRAGLAAAAMFAVAPTAVTYGTEYVYPLAGLICTTLAALVAWTKMHSGNKRLLLATSAVTAAATYTHYIALFYVPLLLVWVLLWSPMGRSGIRVAAAILIGTIPFVLWLPYFWVQSHIGVPYAVATGPAQKLAFVIATILHLMPASTTFWQEACLVLIAPAIFSIVRRAPRSDATALGGVVLGALLLIAAKNLLIIRYIFPLYGLLCAFLGAAIAELAQSIRQDDRLAWQRWGLPAIALVAAAVLFGDVKHAQAASLSPKSGIRTLVADEKLAPQSLYVLAPDYLASTFAFYARDAKVDFQGFVRRDHAEIFRLDRYAQDWRDRRAVTQALYTVNLQARKFRYLDVIVDDQARNSGNVEYGKVWRFLGALQKRYALIRKSRYAGRYETVSEYDFIVNGGAKG